jgi:hypothetical protein
MDLSGINPDTIVSYRDTRTKSSTFLKVKDIFAITDIDLVTRIYKGILSNVHTYDPSKIEELEQLNKALHKRILSLIEEKRTKEPLVSKAVKNIFSFGLYSRQQRSRMRCNDRLHDDFLHHISQVRDSLKTKVASAPIPELEELARIRLPDLQQELERLQQHPRIKRSLERVERGCVFQLTLAHKVAFAHSIELREKLKEKYYVINHGQNLEMMLINIVARRLKQKFEPKLYEHFEILRHNVYLQHIREDEQNVEWFRRKLTQISDHAYRRELICGDCYLESTALAESAMDFFAGRTNIAATCSGSENFISQIVQGILCDYFPNQGARNRFVQELVTLAQTLPRGGTMYSICIPKEKFETTGYFCLPYGQPVDDKKYSPVHLELMQDGFSPRDIPEMPFEGSSRNKMSPQIRLLSHKLTEENGIMIVPNATISQEIVDQMEKDVDLIIQRAQMQFRMG